MITDRTKTTQERIGRLRGYISKLDGALSDAQTALQEKHQPSLSHSSSDLASMSKQQLRTRITKIKMTRRDAQRQLSTASQELGQLTHSAITSEPNVNENFARFQSAERGPSNDSGFQWLRHEE